MTIAKIDLSMEIKFTCQFLWLSSNFNLFWDDSKYGIAFYFNNYILNVEPKYKYKTCSGYNCNKKYKILTKFTFHIKKYALL